MTLFKKKDSVVVVQVGDIVIVNNHAYRVNPDCLVKLPIKERLL